MTDRWEPAQTGGYVRVLPKLYRVRVQTTGSVQPGRGATYWRSEVLYCGPDRLEALTHYHRSKPTDYGGSYGNPAAETLLEVLEVDELPDDEPGDFREMGP